MRYTFNIGNLSIDLVNEWGQFFGKYNWHEFHLLMWRFEKEFIHGMFEMELYLLGFGVRFYWTWNKQMLKDKMDKYTQTLENDEWYEFKRVKKKKGGKKNVRRNKK